MSEQEIGAMAAGGVLGGLLGAIAVFVFIFYILMVIANWKIFTKAGEAGWKSLIPIYNAVILYKIAGISFLKWCLLPALIGGICSSIGQSNENLSTIMNLLYCIALLVIDIKIAIALGKSFDKGTGFIVGLVLFPNIFQLILGFGSAEYKGPVSEA